MSDSHVNQDLLVNNDGGIRRENSRRREVVEAVITDTVGGTDELNDGTSVGGGLVGQSVAVGSTDKAGEETKLILEDEKLNTSELILEEEVLRARSVDAGLLQELVLGGIGVDGEGRVSIELALLSIGSEHGEEITDEDLTVEVDVLGILHRCDGKPRTALGGSTSFDEIGTDELVGLLNVEGLLAATSVETPGHGRSTLVASGSNGDDDVASSTSILGAVGFGRAGKVNLDVARLGGGRGDAELILIGLFASRSIGHGEDNFHGSHVALLLAGVDVRGLTDLQFLARTEDALLLSDPIEETDDGSVGCPLEGDDGAAGRADVHDLVL